MIEENKTTNDSKNIESKPKNILSMKERADLLNRRLRVNVVAQYGLDTNNFHYHWGNGEGEDGSNIDIYEKIGYSVCIDKNKKAITRKGQVFGMTQYLMRIPIEEYKVIQQYKLEEVRETERSIGKKGMDKYGLPEKDIYGDVKMSPEVVKGRIV